MPDIQPDTVMVTLNDQQVFGYEAAEGRVTLSRDQNQLIAAEKFLEESLAFLKVTRAQWEQTETQERG